MTPEATVMAICFLMLIAASTYLISLAISTFANVAKSFLDAFNEFSKNIKNASEQYAALLEIHINNDKLGRSEKNNSQFIGSKQITDQNKVTPEIGEKPEDFLPKISKGTQTAVSFGEDVQ
jgi:hypothetical protein